MNKFELAKQIQETDLNPEALAEIAAVLEKHRSRTHERAIAASTTTPETVNDGLIEAFERDLLAQVNEAMLNRTAIEGVVTNHGKLILIEGPNNTAYFIPRLYPSQKNYLNRGIYYENGNGVGEGDDMDKLKITKLSKGIPSKSYSDYLDGFPLTTVTVEIGTIEKR